MKTLGQYSEALGILKKIHQGRKKELGEDDPDTLDTGKLCFFI
jgi:hypothetical protein